MVKPTIIEIEEQIRKEVKLENPFDTGELKLLKDHYQKSIEIYQDSINDKNNKFIISTKGYVGYIVLQRHIIKIIPKVKTLSILLMLEYGYDKHLQFSDEEIAFPKAGELYGIIIKILIKRLQKLVREGLYKSYKETEENLSCVRGRIMFNQHLYNNLILQNKVYCRYSEFTEDILENQIIKFTLHKLLFEPPLIRGATTAYYEDTRNSLFQLYRFFESASDIKKIDQNDFAKLQYTRLNEHYRETLKICEIIIKNTSIHTNELGEYHSFAFLIDMNNLFEDFVREYLKESLTEYNVTKHHTYLDKNKEIELKPDIVISKRRSNIIMIIDTKYKILDERRQQQEDISQILSYCLAEKATIGLLVYPKFEEEIEKEYDIKNTDKRIVLKTINLSANDRAEFNKNAARFLSDIRKYITYVIVVNP